MDFDYSPKTKELQARLQAFMDEHIYPAEAAYHAEIVANTEAGKRWTPLQTIENLKVKARSAGLWNLFLPVDSAAASGYHGAGLTNQEYAPLAEIMGRVMWSSEVFNCSAPDTGNMETIARYGSETRALVANACVPSGPASTSKSCRIASHLSHPTCRMAPPCDTWLRRATHGSAVRHMARVALPPGAQQLDTLRAVANKNDPRAPGAQLTANSNARCVLRSD
jgi:hypothetical protein